MDEVLRDRLRGYLTTEIEKAKLLAATLRSMKRHLESSTKPFTYIVALESLWAREGEQSHTFRLTGDLSEVIKKAESEYKKLNRRSDVQARYRVSIILKQNPEQSVPVPEAFWDMYRERKTSI